MINTGGYTMSENDVNVLVDMPKEAVKEKSVGAYIGWLILSALPVWLPLIGYIIVAVLAFSGKDLQKKRFFKAAFILHTICLVFAVLVLIGVFGVFGDQIKPFISANY